METVLQVIQEVCRRTGVPIPAIAVTNSDSQTQQIIGLFNELGQDLAQRTRWQVCVRRATWTALGAEDQGSIYDLFNAELDMITSGTLWNSTLGRPLYGPLDDETYQLFKNSIPTGPLDQYRIENDRLLIVPAATAGHQMNAMYRVKYWLKNGVTEKFKITADDDIPRFDTSKLAIGLRAKWKAEKGLPYAEDFRIYEEWIADSAARDATKPTLFVDSPDFRPKPGILVPAGNWPLS